MPILLLAILLVTLSGCQKESNSSPESTYDCSQDCAVIQRILDARNGAFSSLRGETQTEESGRLQWKGKAQIIGATGCFVLETPAEYVCSFGWLQPSEAEERMRVLENVLLEFITQEFNQKREWFGPDRRDSEQFLDVRWSDAADYKRSRDTVHIQLMRASTDRSLLQIEFYVNN